MVQPDPAYAVEGGFGRFSLARDQLVGLLPAHQNDVHPQDHQDDAHPQHRRDGVRLDVCSEE
jgi:hypothetical protein